MPKLIQMPHVVRRTTCYINGLYDILTAAGADYDYYLLCMVGGMASFSYLKFKMSSPPCMVYWGNKSSYLLKQLEEIIGFQQTVSEGKSFKNEFPKIKESLDHDSPVVVGALDMYYLHYFPELYRKQHVPIHYLLVVGYDDERQAVYVHDCSHEGIQQVPYIDFEKCLSMNVPGMSRKNTWRVFELPPKMPSELEIAEKGLPYVAYRMLRPPVSLLGIPAMRQLAKDIVNWDNRDCFNYMVGYAGMTPPLVSADLSQNDGFRFEKARVLKAMGQKYRHEKWTQASDLFAISGKLIIQMCRQAVKYDGRGCAGLLKQIADIEEQAYQLIIG